MTIEVKVPEVGESVTEVYIGDWYKGEGDEVDQDENLVELESEKATFELPAPSAGVISEILKSSGDTAEVGEVIAYIDPSGNGKQADEDESDEKASSRKKKKQDKKAAKKPKKTADADAETEDDGGDRSEPPEIESEPRIMPAARRALDEHGLQAEDVEPTGPGGRLLKEDVLRHVEQGGRAKPQRRQVEGPDGAREEEVVSMSPLRRRIAERLVEAQQTAALLTTFNEIDMSAVVDLRKQYRDAFLEKYEIKLGFMSFFVKASVEALKEFPQVNARIRDDEIVYRNYYDIGIAIGGGKGLVVPVLRNAERMSFAEVELAIDDLSRRAQKNQLDVEELQGGTFTISNGGIYGSLMSTPIVNPPQSGVLGMHAIEDRPVVRNGEIVVRPMMYVALTYDHRIVDGREAVTFLRRIKEMVQQPARILIEV